MSIPELRNRMTLVVVLAPTAPPGDVLSYESRADRWQLTWGLPFQRIAAAPCWPIDLDEIVMTTFRLVAYRTGAAILFTAVYAFTCSHRFYLSKVTASVTGLVAGCL